jgi:acylphosphatase
MGETTRDNEAIESWQVRVRGRVQGVGYRASCVRQAAALGLDGWVRNRRDSSVELLLQGAPSMLAQMRDWLPHGVPQARVDSIEVAPAVRPVDRCNGFEWRPDA